MPLATKQNIAFNLDRMGLLGADTVVLYPYPAIAAIELIHGSSVLAQDLTPASASASARRIKAKDDQN